MSDKLNILIIRTDRIGDVVLTTAAVHAIRKNYPNARLTMLVSSSTRELVEGNPDLDEVILDDREGKDKGLIGFWKQVFSLRAKKFDWVFVFHTKRRTNLICFLAGIPRRTGYKNEKYGFLLTEKIMDDREAGIKHEAEYCLDVLNAIGISAPLAEAKCVLPVRMECEAWADKWLLAHDTQKNKVLLINPSASDPGRQWPAERFAALIEGLQKKYPYPIAVIGAKNSDAAQRLLKLVDNKVIDVTGQTSMSQLISLLRRSRMLISNDTGPVHVAAALDVPVVSIFTRNEPGINPERWRPLGEKTKIVVTPYKGDISFRKAKVIDASYLNAIPVESVAEAVDALLKLC